MSDGGVETAAYALAAARGCDADDPQVLAALMFEALFMFRVANFLKPSK